jgi:predicted phosphodiesterase
MRILLVADIHANWPALQAIQEPHDVCVCLGDLVEYGLEALPCIDWVRRHTRYVVRGNHDHDLAQDVICTGSSGFAYLTRQTRALTQPRLSAQDARYLSGLAVTRTVTLDERLFFLVHATPRDPLDEHAPADVDFWLRRLDGVEARFICVGHTHVPYVLPVGDKVVVNPGSVGLPFDGDPRASYAVITNGEVELKRVAYPVEETIRSVEDSELTETAKDMLAQALRTGGGAEMVEQWKQAME